MENWAVSHMIGGYPSPFNLGGYPLYNCHFKYDFRYSIKWPWKLIWVFKLKMLFYANKPYQSQLFTLCMHHNSILGVTCEHDSCAHSCWISLFMRRLLSGRWGHRRLGLCPQTIACGESCGLLLLLLSLCYLFIYLPSGPICIKLWSIINAMRDMFVISFLWLCALEILD